MSVSGCPYADRQVNAGGNDRIDSLGIADAVTIDSWAVWSRSCIRPSAGPADARHCETQKGSQWGSTRWRGTAELLSPKCSCASTVLLHLPPALRSHTLIVLSSEQERRA